MDKYNLVDIATVIQEGIKKYQIEHPDDYSQENAEKFAVGQVIRLFKGCINPIIIMDTIRLEQSVYKTGTMMRS